MQQCPLLTYNLVTSFLLRRCNSAIQYPSGTGENKFCRALAVMKKSGFLCVHLGQDKSTSNVWSCDVTAEYSLINVNGGANWSIKVWSICQCYSFVYSDENYETYLGKLCTLH